MLIRSYLQRKILIRSSMSADQTVVLITDTNLRRCGLKDCWFSAVSIQYRVVVAVIIDVIIIRHLQYCFVITSCVFSAWQWFHTWFVILDKHFLSGKSLILKRSRIEDGYYLFDISIQILKGCVNVFF